MWHLPILQYSAKLLTLVSAKSNLTEIHTLSSPLQYKHRAKVPGMCPFPRNGRLTNTFYCAQFHCVQYLPQWRSLEISFRDNKLKPARKTITKDKTAHKLFPSYQMPSAHNANMVHTVFQNHFNDGKISME